MHEFFQLLFLFRKFEIKAKLSEKEIHKKVNVFLSKEHAVYNGRIYEGGFTVEDRPHKSLPGGHSRNSLAPVAKAKIFDADGISTVSVVIRPNLVVYICWLILYLLSIIVIFHVPALPFLLLISYFAFIRPSKKLKESLMDLIIEE